MAEKKQRQDERARELAEKESRDGRAVARREGFGGAIDAEDDVQGHGGGNKRSGPEGFGGGNRRSGPEGIRGGSSGRRML